MATFSIGKTATSGFALLAARPVLPLSIALAYGLLNYGPLLAFLALGGSVPSFAGGDGDQQAAVRAVLDQFASPQAIVLGLLWGLSQLALVFVLQTAIYRAVFEPKRSAFGYLRLGGDEVRQLLLTLLVVLLVLPFFVVAILIGVFGAGFAAFAPAEAVRPLQFAAGLLATGGVLWVAVRLSLAAPMTYAEKEVRLFESFRVTEGRFWKLLGLLVVLVAIAALLSLGLAMLLGLIVGVLGLGMLAGGGAFDWADLGKAIEPDLSSLQAFLTPFTLAAAVLDSLTNAIVLIVFGAPLAVAYKALTGRD